MAEKIQHKHMIARVECAWFFDKGGMLELREWLLLLVEKMGMTVMGGPYINWLDRPGLRGWSATVHIETSAITVHSLDESLPVELQLDVYTCGELDVNIIREHLMPFNPSKIDYVILDREKGLKDITHGD